ncbi:uncharacterized protein FIESC28_06930 [Fusarium coffeatum]|uniref:Uncharacterized protein n=1 Tax=Fusarium coffeatum TaxID=231269 RepID=A0A366RH90_9HYPO|nr:uncharacterized protein FIESC28_06930 [Fusarium coffeatum]RBR16521.1 hypothetical protein FIESC28_06930 [Fusarium coffeatum]
MEPVSLLIGIVPLCAQLAKTTTTINNLISSYKSAARELEALSNTLADVANVCESLGDILYNSDTSEYHPSEARLFAALHGRIQECHDRLADVQDIIQIVNGKRRGPFRNEGLFLQFKDKISSCTKRLDKSLSSLNLVLTTSNFIRLLQPPRMEVTILEETDSPSRLSAVIEPDRASISGRSIKVPWVVRVDYGSGSVGERIRNAYFDDDLEEIRELLVQRVITPTTLLGWNDNYTDTGYTILGLAAALTAPRILAFARSQTNMVEEREQFPDGPGVFKLIQESSDLQCAVDYINMRKNGMSPDELDSVLTGVLTLSQLKACIDAYLTWSSPARDRFYKVLGRSVLKAFSNQHLLKHDVGDWASFISEHTARGLDIYSDLHTDFYHNASTLTVIPRRPACPDAAVSNLHLWLDVLELAGVEIGQYLEIETPQCFATWAASAACHMPGYREDGSLINRVLQVQYSKGRRIPYWREEISRACAIRELLVEFPRFLHRETIDTYANWMDTMRLRQAWKAGENTTLIYPEKTTWPVAPKMGDDPRPPDLGHQMDVNMEVKRAVEWLYHEYHQRKRRRERKLERKMRKGAGNKKAHGKMSIPGTWVD